MALLVPGTSRGETPSKYWEFRADAFTLRENLTSGHRYVSEAGLRGEGAILVSWPLSPVLSLDYRGSLFASVVRHRGDDPTRFAIPGGTEDFYYAGQLGTGHQASAKLKLPLSDSWRVGPQLGIGVEAWYRPLSYYEIWVIPSARLGIAAESAHQNRAIRFAIGLKRSISPRVHTETTAAPWNGSTNSTLALGARSDPYASFGWSLDEHRRIAIHYERTRLSASRVIVLSNGNTIYQPDTAISQVGISIAWKF